ncbi:hypothetical protein BCR39DRAFT_541040 [Naematelia encephala]|uniref:Uncharacterized protein n=1 Tax=Naematelia encephala TaxID=71784 RepID=A0A1Y2AW97_9TREE|nr:hypothetical protein BCR39DRAFT_541040 [Naematelia encephala]
MESDPWADTPSSPKQPEVVEVAANGPSTSTEATPTVEQVAIPVGTSSVEETSDHVDLNLIAGSDLTGDVSQETAGVEAGAAEDGGDEFEDFDDFDASAGGPGPSTSRTGEDGEDGFGDFGDFEQGDFTTSEEAVNGDGDMLSNGNGGIVEEPDVYEERFQSLHLDPMPSRAELLDQLTNLLAPLLPSPSDPSLTDEPQRAVGGLSQIMISESSREAYAQLTTAPMLKPLDWTRSRVRRDHLISMGVPVNLDEVDSHRLSTLPPLQINVNPPTPRRADPNARYSSIQKGKGREIPLNSGRNSMPASIGSGLAGRGLVNGDPSKVHGLGARPEIDIAKAEELCGIEEEQLTIMSLNRLKRLQEQLVSMTADASSLLGYLLQLKDAQTQDSDTYNGMISELIANAAKVKSAQSAAASGGVFRRASTRRPNSMSGTNTPRRVGTPTGMR